MRQENELFWTDIKKYEEILSRDPSSYCFAQLAELYRKLGLLDEALDVARRGVEAHPDYSGGLLALGRVYFDKGLKAESRCVLEKVTSSTQENIVAQKLLGQIYLEQNEPQLAEQALRVVLSLSPDDVECRLSLEALTRGSTLESCDIDLDDEELLDEAEIVDDELFQLLTEPAVTGAAVGELPPSEVPFPLEAPEEKDPLTTATLAEIYVAQGFYDQAAKIYRALSAAEPGNEELARRYAEITRLASESAAGGAPADIPSEARAEVVPSASATVEAFLTDPGKRAEAALEQWLAQIQRRRACR